MIYLKYLCYLLRHKWFVFLECLKLGVPLWAAIVHDWQKFTPAEFGTYAVNFFGSWDKDDRPQWLVDAFERAWVHHLHYGPHHWDYWLSRDGVDGLNRGYKALEMPDRYRREMLADWRGAGRAISGKDDTAAWYVKKRDEIILHPKTREWIEHQLGVAFMDRQRVIGEVGE
jgi:hypothetical protein